MALKPVHQSTKRRRRAVGVFLVLSLVMLVAGLGVPAGPEVYADAGPVPQTQPALAFAALAYFNTSCATCHGDYGSFYGPTFGQGLSDVQLHDVVEEMADGPAAAPLAPAELAAVIAYHRSLIAGTPYLAVTERDGTRVAGEVTPGASVSVRTTAGELAAEVQGHAWSVTLAEEAKVEGVQAVRQGQRTTLSAGAGWSHAEPLEAK